MSDHEYQPPPTKVGETRSYLGGSSEKVLVITRRGEDLLEIKLPDNPSYLGTVVEEGDMYHLTGSLNSLSAANLLWSELLDNF